MKRRAKRWITAEAKGGLALRYQDIGDKHLVNILNDVESQRFGSARNAQYAGLSAEAVRRGLFEWKDERKYLEQRSEQFTQPAPVPVVGPAREKSDQEKKLDAYQAARAAYVAAKNAAYPAYARSVR